MSRAVPLLFFALALTAQTPDTAIIHGQVIDPSGAPVPGVRILAKNTQSGLERTAQTDTSGHFSLSGLPVAGAYYLTASKVGFAEARLNALTLTGGVAAAVNLRIDVAGGRTQVTVTGVAGEIRTGAPQLGTHLGAAQVEETPLLGRKISALPILNA